MPVQTIIKTRRDTAANWAASTAVLAAGEAGLETDTGLVKYGNGTTVWSSLRYANIAKLNNVANTTLDADGSIADNEVLAWNFGTSKWMNQTAIEAGLVSTVNGKLERVNSTDEGGQIDFARASDNAIAWAIDVFGSTSTPDLRIIEGANERARIAAGGGLTATPTTPANASTAKNVGFMGLPQVSTATGLSLTAAHAGRHIFTTATGQTHTIPANSSVPLEIGTTIVFINSGAITTTIAITSDTMTLAGTSTTGSRTLGTNGMATAVKVGATNWVISGNGLT